MAFGISNIYSATTIVLQEVWQIALRTNTNCKHLYLHKQK